jgi:predicted transcriptional regulator
MATKSINTSVYSHTIELELVCSAGCSELDCVELTERESTVCNLICRSEKPISFSQLKQASNFHQEIVSRIIHRLIVHHVVKRSDSGYECDCKFVSPVN